MGGRSGEDWSGQTPVGADMGARFRGFVYVLRGGTTLPSSIWKSGRGRRRRTWERVWVPGLPPAAPPSLERTESRTRRVHGVALCGSVGDIPRRPLGGRGGPAFGWKSARRECRHNSTRVDEGRRRALAHTRGVILI